MSSLAGGRSRQSKDMALRQPGPDPALQKGREQAPSRERERARQKPLVRWVIPIGGGVVTGILIVLATPHVAWALRILLAVVAFLYFAGQSAAYLWSSSDQGE